MTVLRLVAVLFLTAAAAPDPKLVVLTASDFPGRARDVSAHAVAPAGYVSSVAFTAPYGASRYTKLTSQALLERNAAAAKGAYAVLLRNYSSVSGRAQLVSRYLPSGTVKRVVAAHPLGVRPVSTELGFMTAAANLSVSLLRVDRIVVVNIAVGRGRGSSRPTRAGSP